MKQISDVFPELQIGNDYRNHPYPSSNILRNSANHIAITFRKDPGYLKIWNDGDRVSIKPYGTKSTIRTNKPGMLFHVNQTVEEFRNEGIDVNKIQVQHELEGKELSLHVHLIRIFSDLIGNSGARNASRRSIMF